MRSLSRPSPPKKREQLDGDPGVATAGRVDDRRDVVGGVVAGVQEVGQDEHALGAVADRGVDRVGDRRFGELEEAGDDGCPEPTGDPGR